MELNLGERAAKLEWCFFQMLDLARLQELRHRFASLPPASALREAAAIDDTELLDALVTRQVPATTLLAVTLVPLLEVAWVDGSIQRGEREALGRAAGDHGFEEGSAGRELLQAWLHHRPDASLRAAWSDYTSALLSQLDASKRELLRDAVVQQARTIARAAGGLLGLTQVSAQEEELLHQLEHGFDHPEQLATLFTAPGA